MSREMNDELLAKIINNITDKLSKTLLKEFLKIEDDHRFNIILIKSVQLLLANILCQVAINNEELDQLANGQGAELRELIYNCAYTGFYKKFELNRH